MPQGLSIHIGLNSVDPNHYNGWAGKLQACEADAKDMARIASDKDFEGTTILTAKATADAVKSAIGDAAGKLEKGDILFLSYSGHGGQVPDRNGDEADTKDETWVLYDRQLVDDEIYALYSQFEKGTRILVFSDSCHSGTVNRDIFNAAVPHVVEAAMVDDDEPRTKDLPRDVADSTYEQNKDLYDGIQKSHPAAEEAEIGATVLLISGCQDNQLSLDGTRNGLFTQQLLSVWNDGKWRGSHRRFHKAIGAKMPPTQSPNYNAIGATNGRFERQKPLTI
ncbi:MAG TPA: caspase family protein [Gaiellaceae bacterium]|nr:caspase family protein [Gaiellaceae bacterium]